MKSLITLVLTLALASPTFGWSNGGRSKNRNSPKFGTHDWIAYEGYLLARGEANLNWIKNNLVMFFIGTEAPDEGTFGLDAGTNYNDQGACHCVLYNENLEVIRQRAVMRAQEEYDRAREALARGDKAMAAFYAGAMAHYIGDLGQFMHLMGRDSRWNGGESENSGWHHRYEEVIDKTMHARKRTSTLLKAYIERRSVAGDSAGDVTLAVAKYVDTGGGTTRNVGWMYDQWEMTISKRQAGKTNLWDRKFLEQSGRNVNVAANGIAKLLAKLSR